jgi:hypothetical protein
MRLPGAAHAAGAPVSAAIASRRSISSGAGGENRQLFLQLNFSTVRAGGAFPLAGTNQDFTIFITRPAMKLVNRHAATLPARAKISSLVSDVEFFRREFRRS